MKYWQNAISRKTSGHGTPFTDMAVSPTTGCTRFSAAKAYGYDRLLSFLRRLYAAIFIRPPGVFLYGNGKFISHDGPASIASKARMPLQTD